MLKWHLLKALPILTLFRSLAIWPIHNPFSFPHTTQNLCPLYDTYQKPCPILTPFRTMPSVFIQNPYPFPDPSQNTCPLYETYQKYCQLCNSFQKPYHLTCFRIIVYFPILLRIIARLMTLIRSLAKCGPLSEALSLDLIQNPCTFSDDSQNTCPLYEPYQMPCHCQLYYPFQKPCHLRWFHESSQNPCPLNDTYQKSCQLYNPIWPLLETFPSFFSGNRSCAP